MPDQDGEGGICCCVLMVRRFGPKLGDDTAATRSASVCCLHTGLKCCCCVLLWSPHLQGVPAGSTPDLSAAQQPPSHAIWNCIASKQGWWH